jgi:hypothetical protein
MTDRMLTSGAPVPEDNSHTELRPDGQQKGYICLTPAELSKGFVQPVRNSYIHKTCGSLTRMSALLAETYARDPWFYSGTFCCACGAHFPLEQFVWDGTDESLDPAHWTDEKFQQVVEEKKRLKEI